MNTKSSWILLALIMLAIIFVPLIPNDAPIDCTEAVDACDEGVGYVSVYTKFLSK